MKMVKRAEKVRKSVEKGKVVQIKERVVPPPPEDEIAKSGREKGAHRAFSPAPAGEGGRWRCLRTKLRLSESKVGGLRSEDLGRPIIQLHHPPW